MQSSKKKDYLKLFRVLIIQIFRGKSNIVILRISKNFKTSGKAPICQ